MCRWRPGTRVGIELLCSITAHKLNIYLHTMPSEGHICFMAGSVVDWIELSCPCVGLFLH
jgi:hypothetical protein